jgi:hypothetical protein
VNVAVRCDLQGHNAARECVPIVLNPGTF